MSGIGFVLALAAHDDARGFDRLDHALALAP